MKREHGVTLVELMVAILLAAIVALVAVPAFNLLLERNRVQGQVNELVAALNHARTEAIRRGSSVAVSANGSAWCLHLEGGSCQDALAVYAIRDRIEFKGDGAQSMVFNALGEKTSPGSTVSVTVQPAECPSGSSDRARRITVENTGRVSTRQENCQ